MTFCLTLVFWKRRVAASAAVRNSAEAQILGGVMDVLPNLVVQALIKKLAKVTNDISTDSLRAWYDGSSIRFEFRGVTGIRYKGSETAGGILVKGPHRAFYTVVTPGAKSGKRVLETYFGEEFSFVKGYLENDVNYKYYASPSGTYQMITWKEGGRTGGKIVSPEGRVISFTGDENYVEIENGTDC